MADHENRKPGVPAMRTGGRLAPINPQSFEDVQRMAKMAVKAGLAPVDRKDDEETAIAKATGAIMQGLECGVPPMQALQGIAIINGRAVMWGDLLTALLWSKGFKLKKWIEGEGDARVGHARIVRPDGEVIEKTFSVAQAKQARLWDERQTVKKKWNDKWEDKPNDSPWFKFPDRMLEWRPFGYAVKDGASDATHGMLVREEAAPEYNQTIDVTPEGGRSTVLAVPTDIEDGTTSVDGAVTATVTEAEASQDGPLANQDAYLANLADQLKEGSREEFDETWTAHLEMQSRLSEETQAKATAMREEHIKRFETKPAAKKKPKGKDEGGELL